VYAGVLTTVFRGFCRAFGLRAGPLYMLRLVMTSPLYQLALSLAAIWAKIRHIRGIKDWVVTEKDEIHLRDDPLEGVTPDDSLAPALT